MPSLSGWVGSLFAQAAYALFVRNQPVVAPLVQRERGDFTDTEVSRFLSMLGQDNLELRHHLPNDATGFSASVFFDRAAGRYVLALRGTEQFILDILGEDLGRIGGHGFAGSQAVSLYRYYRRLTTAPGQPVSYSDAETRLLLSLRAGVPVDLSARSGFANRLRAELAADRGEVAWAGAGGPVIPPGSLVTATGHSLGGHLALLFGAFFPANTDHIYTYNAPGLIRRGEEFLGRFGVRMIGGSQVTNVASVMGSELVFRIGSRPGTSIPTYTEPSSTLYNHSIVPLADALAVYNAFSVLSPDLWTADVSAIISAAAYRPAESLERTLDYLRTMIGFPASTTLIARELQDLVQRENYYSRLFALLDGRTVDLDYGAVSLVGRSALELVEMAARDVGVRYALGELIPFAMSNADFSSFPDSYSSGWLASRAEMLVAEMGRNLMDLPFATTDLAESLLFEDRARGLRVSVLRGSDALLARQHLDPNNVERLDRFLHELAYARATVFGSNEEGQAGNIQGLAGADRLFGGSAGNLIEGLGGADYIEGGAGNDTMLGGLADDTLIGGGGSDRLEGGAGNDEYLFGEVVDSDTIVDRDGSIFVGQDLLTGGVHQADGSYRGSASGATYAFSGSLEAGGTLTINSALRVENFRNGDLGIRLSSALDPEPAPTPTTSTTFLGDYLYEVLPPPGEDLLFDAYGNPLSQSRVEATPGSDDSNIFLGTPGNDRFEMGAGNDFVQDRYGGNDYFELGEGNDGAFGGRGHDLIVGGAERDALYGGRGNDTLIALQPGTLEEDLANEGPSPSPGLWGDSLFGGDGDDRLYGDPGGNFMDGGEGSDQMFGGAGGDTIVADDENVSFALEVYDTTFLHPWLDDRPLDYLDDFPWLGELTGDWLNLGATVNPSLNPAAGTGADYVDAGAGDDRVYAGGGDDLAFGGTGNDSIHSGGGSDVAFGGAGNDTLEAGVAGDTAGDHLDAGDGSDLLRSHAGYATMVGGAGNDWLHALGTHDVLLGGAGDDHFWVFAPGGTLVDGGTGRDQIALNAPVSGQPDTVVRWGLGQGADFLSGTGVAIEVTGGVRPDEMSAALVQRMVALVPLPGGFFPPIPVPVTGVEFGIEGSTDTLFVFGALDNPNWERISFEFEDGTHWDSGDVQALLDPPEPESEAAHSISGSSGDDLLYGSSGEDLFVGAGGNDWLVGGEGNDIYQYSEGDGFDDVDDIDTTPGNSDRIVLGQAITAADVEVFATESDYILVIGDGGLRLRGARNSGSEIEVIEFADGTQWDPGDLASIATILPANTAPEMPESYGAFEIDAGSTVSIALPQETIVDTDQFDSISLYAITAEGDPLPEWLTFDANALTLTASPGEADAGTHALLIIAADSNGAAAFGELTISVPGEIEAPTVDEAPAAEAAVEVMAGPVPVARAMISEPSSASVDSLLLPRIGAPISRVAEPLDPLYREMTARFDMLLQVGRANLTERYAEAVREFEERRRQREEPPEPPPPTEQEIMEWNQAMHAWHERHPGFTDVDGVERDGVWTMGWGAGGGESTFDELLHAGDAHGLRGPHGLPRVGDVAPAPGLIEGIRNLR